jgi:hypothetical protein
MTVAVLEPPIMTCPDLPLEVQRIIQRMAAQDAALPALTSQTRLNLTSGALQSSGGTGLLDAKGILGGAINPGVQFTDNYPIPARSSSQQSS